MRLNPFGKARKTEGRERAGGRAWWAGKVGAGSHRAEREVGPGGSAWRRVPRPCGSKELGPNGADEPAPSVDG